MKYSKFEEVVETLGYYINKGSTDAVEVLRPDNTTAAIISKNDEFLIQTFKNPDENVNNFGDRMRLFVACYALARTPIEQREEMKIKTKKTMDVLELAQAVRDGDCTIGHYNSARGTRVYFSENNIGIAHLTDQFLRLNEEFAVETEEELTKDTVLEEVMIIVEEPNTKERAAIFRQDVSIDKCISQYWYEMLSVSVVDEFGRPTLVWSKEHGIPDDASEWIVKLQDEKADLTALVNKLSERNKFLEGEYKFYRGREKAEEWF